MGVGLCLLFAFPPTLSGTYGIETCCQHTTATMQTPLSQGTAEVTIIRPLDSMLYLFNREITNVPGHTIIIGNITVLASAFSVVGIEALEFSVDNVVKHTETNRLVWLLIPWDWDETIFLRHELKVTAYDNLGATASDEKIVWIFNI
jgi:hypothetical protein